MQETPLAGKFTEALAAAFSNYEPETINELKGILKSAKQNPKRFVGEIREAWESESEKTEELVGG